MKRMRIPQIQQKAKRGERLTMLTAYDATFAKLMDEAGIDMILVGDSMGMVIQGHETTVPVTLDEIIYHTQCVMRGSHRAFVVADLPFMSYQSSQMHALLAAGRALKEGRAHAVKIEGGMEMAETVMRMTAAGIPVMAHIGLRPQRFHQMGGYRLHGKTEEEARQLLEEARSFEEAGAFAIVLEGIAIESAAEITEAVNIPTIGIGSGPHCSGQVLVIYDLLGLDPTFKPSFVKTYADGHALVTSAIKDYMQDVQAGRFPEEHHGFHRGT